MASFPQVADSSRWCRSEVMLLTDVIHSGSSAAATGPPTVGQLRIRSKSTGPSHAGREGKVMATTSTEKYHSSAAFLARSRIEPTQRVTAIFAATRILTDPY